MIFKKFFLVLVCLMFALANPVLASAATLSLSPASGTFNKGCSFSLNIILDSGPDQVEGTDVNFLLYDNSRFTATSVEQGTIFSDYPINSIDSSAGKIYISGVDANNHPFNGTGTFAKVNFTVKATAPAGATQMSFAFNPNDKTNTTDSNVEVIQDNTVVDVLSSVTNGSYTVGSGSCLAQASSSPSSSTGTGTGTGTGSKTKGGVGGIGDATGAAQTLPLAGSLDMTMTLAITGGILTLLGILGLVLL